MGRCSSVLLVLVGLMLGGFALADKKEEFVLTAKEGRFSPTEIKVPAGKKFVLVVKNEGPGAEEFESHELNREKVIPPGQTAKITIGPLEKGEYPFFGEFHPETAKGKIIVE